MALLSDILSGMLAGTEDKVTSARAAWRRATEKIAAIEKRIEDLAVQQKAALREAKRVFDTAKAAYKGVSVAHEYAQRMLMHELIVAEDEAKRAEAALREAQQEE